MDEVEEILNKLESPIVNDESMEEKHQRLDEKLNEVHEQLALLNEHLSKE